MLVPLYFLAAGAVLAGVVFYSMFFHDVEHVDHFFAGSLVVSHEFLEAAHAVPLWVKWSSTIAMLIGFVVAWYMYIRAPETPRRLAETNPGLYQFLLNKWYFDELYDVLFVRPSMALGRFFWKRGDEQTIDRFGPHGAAYAVGVGNRITARLQSGYVYSYALVMLLGLIAAATWVFWWVK